MISDQIVEEIGATKKTYARKHTFGVIGDQTNDENVTDTKINLT